MWSIALILGLRRQKQADFCEFKPAWSTKGAPGQSELSHKETLNQEKTKTREKTNGKKETVCVNIDNTTSRYSVIKRMDLKSNKTQRGYGLKWCMPVTSGFRMLRKEYHELEISMGYTMTYWFHYGLHPQPPNKNLKKFIFLFKMRKECL